MTLTAILCKPGEDARVVEIEKGCEPLQKAVGGYITSVRLSEGALAFVHDEGLILGLPWNRQLGPQTYLAGPIIVVGCTESGETRSLLPTEQADVLRLLNVIAPRLDHHKAASFEELESWVGTKTIRFFSGEGPDIATMQETCTECGDKLSPEQNGFCPMCDQKEET